MNLNKTVLKSRNRPEFMDLADRLELLLAQYQLADDAKRVTLRPLINQTRARQRQLIWWATPKLEGQRSLGDG